MRKLYFLILPLLFGCAVSTAQTAEQPERSKFNTYLEFGTVLIVTSVSVNGELLFASSPSEEINWYARGGVGVAGVFYGPAGYGGLGGVTMLTGKKNHHLEVSGGVFMGSDSGMGMEDGFFALPLLDVGYRFQKPEKGFVFRVKVGALGAGFGLGYAF